MFIILNLEKNKMVAKPGSVHSYTGNPCEAQLFKTREDAEKNKCGNETVLDAMNVFSIYPSF